MRPLFLVLGICSAMPAQAEVVHASANGFESRHVLEVADTPRQALSRFGDVAKWWNPDHSYSGKSENLRLGLKAGDCFCEALPDGGGVEHMRVAYVAPDNRLVMTGALGPLLYEAATGVMDVQFTPAATGTRVTMTYRAAGFAKGNADKLAPLVDRVLAEQMNRYEAYGRDSEARSSVTKR